MSGLEEHGLPSSDQMKVEQRAFLRMGVLPEVYNDPAVVRKLVCDKDSVWQEKFRQFPTLWPPSVERQQQGNIVVVTSLLMDNRVDPVPVRVKCYNLLHVCWSYVPHNWNWFGCQE